MLTPPRASRTSWPSAAIRPAIRSGEWVAHTEGVSYAEELVRLVKELGDFCVGVAAFPYGHPRSPDADSDLRYLLAKIRAGADFAISQLFFEPEAFLRLRDRLVAAGCDTPLLPGIMPLTTVRTLQPRTGAVRCPAARRPRGAARAVHGGREGVPRRGDGRDGPLCERLLAEGVPALHFYTLNRSPATVELVTRLGLAAAAPVGVSGRAG